MPKIWFDERRNVAETPKVRRQAASQVRSQAYIRQIALEREEADREKARRSENK